MDFAVVIDAQLQASSVSHCHATNAKNTGASEWCAIASLNVRHIVIEVSTCDPLARCAHWRIVNLTMYSLYHLCIICTQNHYKYYLFMPLKG